MMNNIPLNQKLDHISSLSPEDVRERILALVRDVRDTASVESFCVEFEHLFTYGDRSGLSPVEEQALSALFDTVAYFGPKAAREEWDGHTDEDDVLKAIADVRAHVDLA